MFLAFVSVEMEKWWRDTNTIHVKPAIICQIGIEVAHNSVKTRMIADETWSQFRGKAP